MTPPDLEGARTAFHGRNAVGRETHLGGRQAGDRVRYGADTPTGGHVPQGPNPGHGAGQHAGTNPGSNPTEGQTLAVLGPPRSGCPPNSQAVYSGWRCSISASSGHCRAFDLRRAQVTRFGGRCAGAGTNIGCGTTLGGRSGQITPAWASTRSLRRACRIRSRLTFR